MNDKNLVEVGEFDKWNDQKKVLNFSKKHPFFKEGEIRWSYLGKNINSEIFGKGRLFTRPVLVFKVLYGSSCLVIPLTSNHRDGTYFYSFSDSRDQSYCAIFSQMRYVDGVRIGSKLGFLSADVLNVVRLEFFNFINS